MFCNKVWLRLCLHWYGLGSTKKERYSETVHFFPCGLTLEWNLMSARICGCGLAHPTSTYFPVSSCEITRWRIFPARLLTDRENPKRFSQTLRRKVPGGSVASESWACLRVMPLWNQLGNCPSPPVPEGSRRDGA